MSRNRAANILPDTYAVLRRPVLTEKSHDGLPVKQEPGQEHRARYTFEVHPKATKSKIKLAIEAAFGVTVASVNTVIIKPKRKTFRMAKGGAGGQGFTRESKRGHGAAA